ncbi:hypothetical protein AMS68_001056 [Peltaster fructicola]|uniref:Myb-like domain-containing protein n=1 Tax=Peltaster fructicola TaxID=286661 RepID=A0A6H0XLN5_9PEZI|nr:hypothetical protein AMS68_001056 [Peltaster fructicola]
MKVRKSAQIALLLIASCSAAAVEPVVASKKVEAGGKLEDAADVAALERQIQGVLNTKSAAPTAATQTTQPGRAYLGTDSAPIDGLDGKPHAGPFVDLLPDTTVIKKANAAATAGAKAAPTLLERLQAEVPDLPQKNDGVMNDESRPVPQAGKTGTEGGVSEKEKSKSKQGPLVENTPQTPKVQPPLPHSEQERIREQQEKDGVKAPADSDAIAKTGQEKLTGSMGIEKPEDLPAKPVDLPHPDGKGSNGRGWLKDTMPYTEGQKPEPTKHEPPKVTSNDDGHQHSWEEWMHSFVVSLTMIIFTEIGDKTFLVAALMAMRHDRLVVFSAAFSALIAMTVLSAVFGHLAPTLLPKRLTTLAAALLFIIFGARMLREGLSMSKNAGVGEEMREVEAELEEKEHDLARNASRKDGAHILESGRKDDFLPKAKQSPLSGLANLLGLVLSPAWVQTFIMTFLGEWGDRSQIATIAMAAGQDYWWVTLGAILGHAFCTGLAVIGGRALAGKVSMRVVTIGGAVAFLFFGVLYMVEVYLEGKRTRSQEPSRGDAELSEPANDYEDRNDSQSRTRELSRARSSAPPTIAEGQLIDNEDASNLDPELMEADLKYLDSDANDLLDLMLPADDTQGLQDPYSSWDEQTKRLLDRERSRFGSTTEHFTAGDRYINPEAVSQKLFANNGELAHDWRPHNIVYKANLVQLLSDLLLLDGRPDLDTLEYVENCFPKMIAGSAYNTEAYELAIEFTTQMVLGRLKAVSSPSTTEFLIELVRDSFLILSDDRELYRHWSSLGADTLRNGKHPQSMVTNRINELIKTLRRPQRRSGNMKKLRDDHSWGDFTSAVLQYCQSRRQELEAGITRVGGSKAIQQAVRLVSQGDTPWVTSKSDDATPQSSTNALVPSMRQYSSAGAFFVKQQNRKKRLAGAQNVPATVEEDVFDLEDEPQSRDFGHMPISTARQPGSSQLQSGVTPHLPDIEPTQDAGIQDMELHVNRRSTTATRRGISPGPSRRHTQLATMQDQSSDSSSMEEEDADLDQWESMVNDLNIRRPNTNLIGRRKPRPWTTKEEDRVRLIVRKLGLTAKGVTGSSIKQLDTDIDAYFDDLQPELESRTIADIKDKARLMKRDLLIKCGSINALPPGWDGIWLPKQELDRVARAGIVYDQEAAQELYKEKQDEIKAALDRKERKASKRQLKNLAQKNNPED